MIEQGPASEDAVVLAFVLAEIDSERFRDRMQARGLDRALLVGTTDPSDAEANRNRRLMLGDVRLRSRPVAVCGLSFEHVMAAGLGRAVRLSPAKVH